MSLADKALWVIERSDNPLTLTTIAEACGVSCSKPEEKHHGR